MRVIALVLLSLAGMSFSAPATSLVVTGVLPSCLGDPVANVHLTVAPDGTLHGGRTVYTLSGILLPGAKFDPPSHWRGDALARMGDVTRGPVMLYPAGAPDRYGRQPVHLAADGLWLQGDLLARGLARADPAAGVACATDLLAVEGGARATRTGLWADPAYAVRPPDGARPGQFQIIEGRVLAVAKKDGRVFLNFGADWKTDFTVTITPADMRRFRHARLDPMVLTGRRVRVRGIVQRYHGTEIELAGPEGLEVLP